MKIKMKIKLYNKINRNKNKINNPAEIKIRRNNAKALKYLAIIRHGAYKQQKDKRIKNND